MKRMTTILWDWNGTLIDDVELAVRIDNELFPQWGYPGTTVEEYRSLFTFPVKDYYLALGVKEEDFPPLAQAWFDEYTRLFPGTPLHRDAAEAIARFRDSGFSQVILSASREQELRQQVDSYPELRGQFQQILGLNHHLATSKVELARTFLRESGIRPEDCWFLGDSCHDAEAAAAIGCRCLLIEGGHQSRERMLSANVPVLASRTLAVDYVLSRTARGGENHD